MSEYWKSTPKYWCKHCKTFVRDTKLEKTNHEATPRHQGNLKRFLRELHKGHEREERDKQRAKDEVERLNGVVTGSISTANAATFMRNPALPAASASRQATPADRKKQLAQLADLGVAVPDEFRKEMAMAGDWQTTSERHIYDEVKKEEDDRDVKPDSLAMGVRKRKLENDVDEDADAEETVVRRGWGSKTRAYPGAGTESDNDLDSLLKSTITVKHKQGVPDEMMQSVSSVHPGQTSTAKEATLSTPTVPSIRHEDDLDASAIKQEDEIPETGVAFKKRKAKPIRHK